MTDTVLTTTTSVFTNTLLQAVLPILVDLLSVWALIGIGILTAYAKRKFGVEVTEKQRAGMKEAILTGVTVALAKKASATMSTPALIQIAAEEGIAHARVSAKETIAKLKPSDVVLRNIALAIAANKVEEHNRTSQN